MNLSLGLAILSLLVWVFLVYLHPVHAGWPHLFLGLGVALLVRRLVAGRHAW